MKKKIYVGDAKGLFSYGSFNKFMKRKRASLLFSQSGVSDKLFQIWVLDGVGVLYKRNNDHIHPRAYVTIATDKTRRQLSKIERIILREADKHNS